MVINVSSTSSVISDSVPSSFTAVTATLYFVPTLRPVSSYLVSFTGVAFTFSPSRYTLYPSTAALARTESQVTSAFVCLISEIFTLVGAAGFSGAGFSLSNVVNVVASGLSVQIQYLLQAPHLLLLHLHIRCILLHLHCRLLRSM